MRLGTPFGLQCAAGPSLSENRKGPIIQYLSPHLQPNKYRYIIPRAASKESSSSIMSFPLIAVRRLFSNRLLLHIFLASWTAMIAPSLLMAKLAQERHSPCRVPSEVALS